MPKSKLFFHVAHSFVSAFQLFKSVPCLTLRTGYAMQQELAHFSQQTTRFSVTLSTLANAQREYSESLSENVWSQVSFLLAKAAADPTPLS